MATKTMTIFLNDIEITVDVSYSAWSASRGYRNSMGVPEEPDEDAGCEVEKVLWHTVDVRNNPVIIDIIEYADTDQIEENLMESFADDDGRDE